MTLKGHYALCFKIRAFSGAHRKNLNKDRPTLSAAEINPNDSSFWQYKAYADIRGGSMERVVKRQWGYRKRQFSYFEYSRQNFNKFECIFITFGMNHPETPLY